MHRSKRATKHIVAMWRSGLLAERPVLVLELCPPPREMNLGGGGGGRGGQNMGREVV